MQGHPKSIHSCDGCDLQVRSVLAVMITPKGHAAVAANAGSIGERDDNICFSAAADSDKFRLDQAEAIHARSACLRIELNVGIEQLLPRVPFEIQAMYGLQVIPIRFVD